MNDHPKQIDERSSMAARILGLILASLLILTNGAPAQTTRAEDNQQSGSTPVYLPAVQSPPGPMYLPVIMNQPILPPQTGPSIFTSSIYMKTVDTSAAYNLGCELGTRDHILPGPQDNIVVLDYGPPRYISGIYGTKLFSGGYVSTDQIAASAESYGLGYYVCSGGDTQSHVTIGIGTNNYIYPDCAADGNCQIYAVNYNHGRAWAQMVNSVNNWLVSNQYSGQVSAAGANDIELSWNTYASTKDWLDGYDSINNYMMLNFGALPGCPYLASPGAQCGSYPYLWSKEQVWYVIWGSEPVYPIPEIYLNSGVNAQQWYLMSVYAYTQHGLAIQFKGLMTQYQSCLQRPGDSTCGQLDNTPLQGWTQLSTLVNSDPRTAHLIRWVTDIKWFGE